MKGLLARSAVEPSSSRTIFTFRLQDDFYQRRGQVLDERFYVYHQNQREMSSWAQAKKKKSLHGNSQLSILTILDKKFIAGVAQHVMG